MQVTELNLACSRHRASHLLSNTSSELHACNQQKRWLCQEVWICRIANRNPLAVLVEAVSSSPDTGSSLLWLFIGLGGSHVLGILMVMRMFEVVAEPEIESYPGGPCPAAQCAGRICGHYNTAAGC